MTNRKQNAPTLENASDAELRKQFAMAQRFMRVDTVKWIASNEKCASLVMHPIAIMAYEQLGTIEEAAPGTPVSPDPDMPTITVNKKPIMQNLQVLPNQVNLVGYDGKVFASVFMLGTMLMTEDVKGRKQ
ncbi:MAG TPA: hypothetical protein VGQ12_07635 [Candidatus Angelobacter sp.]|jgi:hypothetical protein|nr:hypothetical protein [Candidatus Angelobacter sp.]